MTHEYDFYNNQDFNIFFTNKSSFTHNLMAGTESIDEKYSIFTINFFPKKYQDNKVGETKCLNFLILLTMLFLLKLKFYLDKNRISCLIFVGFFKFLTSLWCPEIMN